jgi:(S)-ureidoglycine aminohydrolase
MNSPYGQTRTRVAARHALIAPDGHVKSNVPGITGAETIILINEAMGAGFAQVLVTFERGGRARVAEEGTDTFGYVIGGSATIAVGGLKKRCSAGAYFYAPIGVPWSITAPTRGARVMFFEKEYEPLAGVEAPWPLIGDSLKVKGEPFLGDPDARLQVLLPDSPAFDMAVNIFTYKPGATLPFVETHVMEHGLVMLSGQGVYRLEDSWYPVGSGDVIWMAPYCPQWFVAMGKEPARYLYYKDVNRAAL